MTYISGTDTKMHNRRPKKQTAEERKKFDENYDRIFNKGTKDERTDIQTGKGVGKDRGDSSSS